MGLWRGNRLFRRRVWNPHNKVSKIERIRLLESFYHQQNAFKESVEFEETPYYQQNAFKEGVEFTESITFENS